MKFLVVDSSPKARDLVIKSLTKMGYKTFEEADNGLVALSKLKSQKFDFVITDWNMPVMNGLDMLKEIRSDPFLNDLPVLMVTSRNSRQDVIEAVMAKASSYMIKPVIFGVFKNKVTSILKSAGRNLTGT